MKIAIPVWDERVSPVFDVARSIRIVDIVDGAVVDVSNRELESEQRTATLIKLGVDLVVCSAISIPLESTLWVSGVEVIPDTCGGAGEIIQALASGDRTLKRFRSPGNNRRHRPPPEVSPHHPSGTRTSR